MARGIVLVHGMGRHRRGGFLTGIVNPLTRYLESRGGKVDFEPEIALGFDGNPARPAEVTLNVYGPEGFYERWEVQEAHWEDAFRAPGLREVVAWGRDLVRDEVRAIARVLDDPLNESPGDSCDEARSRRTGPRTDSPARRRYPNRVRRYYRDQAFVFRSVAWLVGFAGAPLFALLGVLLKLRGLPSPPAGLTRFSMVSGAVSLARGAVNAAADLVAPFAVYTIGDVKAVLDDPVAADAMRRSVEARVIEMLQDDEIDSITVVAHSLGALISYDALTEGRPIDTFLRANPDRRRTPGSQQWRRITWVTVGGALNRGYSMTVSRRGPMPRTASAAPSPSPSDFPTVATRAPLIPSSG